MVYEKAEAVVVDFENEDIIATSAGCERPQFDADNCDGQTQAVTKPF